MRPPHARAGLLDHFELILDVVVSVICLVVAALVMQGLPYWRELVAFALAGVYSRASEQPWQMLKTRARRLWSTADSPRSADQDHRNENAHHGATLPPESPTLRPQEPLPGWWCISSEAIMQALRAVAQGDDPGIVYAELYSNSTHEQPD